MRRKRRRKMGRMGRGEEGENEVEEEEEEEKYCPLLQIVSQGHLLPSPLETWKISTITAPSAHRRNSSSFSFKIAFPRKTLNKNHKGKLLQQYSSLSIDQQLPTCNDNSVMPI